MDRNGWWAEKSRKALSGRLRAKVIMPEHQQTSDKKNALSLHNEKKDVMKKVKGWGTSNLSLSDEASRGRHIVVHGCQ